MSSNTSGEDQIREAMIKGDVVDIMVALPTKLFVNTQIPACLWFLVKKKPDHRKGKVLFIDARKMGTMVTRKHRVLTQEDIDCLHNTAESWRNNSGYGDVSGFCQSATIADIEKNGFVLTPGRYVGAEDIEDDGEPFEEKMTRLVVELKDLLAQGQELDQHITQNLMRLGYE
jgi:type I restriction enzyme M protein